jgi:ubiquinone/menaquinone biosynthesis C-methylase UbiE
LERPAKEPIEPTPDPRAFYEEAYSTHDERNQRWRSLVASQNIKSILRLVEQGKLRPQRVIDVGCGDGSLLDQMSGHGVAESFVGYEIAPSAVEFAQGRSIAGVERVELFDGRRLPEPDRSFDLGVLNFVLEHTSHPGELLRETSRVASTVLVSIVLDDTLSARRAAHEQGAQLAGHVQRFNRESARHLIADARLTIVSEDIRPPTVAVTVFWSDERPVARLRAHGAAYAKQALHRLAPPLAHRSFAVCYRALCQASPNGA